jgi:hypothetical protein
MRANTLEAKTLKAKILEAESLEASLLEANTLEAEILEVEERLRAAMLTSNVAELDALIDDRLLFVGPEGNLYHKVDDLELHRLGQTQFNQIELEDIQIQPYDSMAIAVVLANLSVTFKGQVFEGHSRYTRVWVKGDRGWQIVAGSICSVTSVTGVTGVTGVTEN